MVRLGENVLAGTHGGNWAGQHSELLCWTSNGQFESEMNSPLERVSLSSIRGLVPALVSYTCPFKE